MSSDAHVTLNSYQYLLQVPRKLDTNTPRMTNTHILRRIFQDDHFQSNT